MCVCVCVCVHLTPCSIQSKIIYQYITMYVVSIHINLFGI